MNCTYSFSATAWKRVKGGSKAEHRVAYFFFFYKTDKAFDVGKFEINFAFEFVRNGGIRA